MFFLTEILKNNVLSTGDIDLITPSLTEWINVNSTSHFLEEKLIQPDFWKILRKVNSTLLKILMFANSTLLKIFMDLAQKFTKNNEISAILYAFVWIALVFCMSFVSI